MAFAGNLHILNVIRGETEAGEKGTPMRHSVLIVGAVLAVGGGAAAQQPAPDGARNPPVVVTGKQRKICEESVPTGSIMTRRVCKTAEQWEAERERSLIALEHMRNRQETNEQVEVQRNGN
jgi:hypothetical protein